MILAFTFLMHFARETWDMIMVPFYDGFTGSGIAIPSTLNE